MYDGKTYMFKKSKYWKLFKPYYVGQGYPKHIRKKKNILASNQTKGGYKWKGVPDDIDEGFVWGKNWNTYFFKVICFSK